MTPFYFYYKEMKIKIQRRFFTKFASCNMRRMPREILVQKYLCKSDKESV